MTKDELRKIYKGRRSEMDPEAKRTADIAICSAIRALPEYMNATRILVYSPIRREIDLNYLFEYISEDGKKTMFPRCFGEKIRFADISDVVFAAYEKTPEINGDLTIDNVYEYDALAREIARAECEKIITKRI